MVQQRRALFLPLLVGCILSSRTTSGFNLLDVAVPTVTSSGLPNGADIAFGFTLAQHMLPDGQKVALVSAPKDNGRVQREGGVYHCPFENNMECQNVSAFQTRTNRNMGAFTRELSNVDESYIGQLMGYSLRSFSNHVVACAPLYSTPSVRNNYDVGIAEGRCVVLHKNLSDSVLQVSQVDVTSSSKLNLAGLDTGITETNLGERLAVSNNDQTRNPPGDLFVLSPNNIRSQQSFIRSSTVSGVFGYHMETGNFVDLSRKQFAVSAPKDRTHIGSIQILDTDTTTGAVSVIAGDPQEPDGYFGYDFAAVNFSTGGYHSLVVGCPLCNRDRGRVYVYVHNGDTSNPFRDFTPLDSPSSVTGRFGIAVEDMGDIDLDGFSDVAISAPYINEGVVYIFRGSASGLVTDTYQEIPALPNGAKAFGYSLSGGLDIDENGYPDLTIGDLSGSQVISLRAVPLVNVTLDFPEPQKVVDLASNQRCQIQSTSLICFTVRPCFSYTPIHGNVSQFELKYTLVLDEQDARVGLMEQDRQFGSNVVVRNITIPGPDTQRCHEFTFALRADFIETVPILVQLSVDDADQPLALEEDQSSLRLGGPLHPMLSRYIQGEERAALSASYSVSFILSCAGGTSPDCEPVYRIQTNRFPSSSKVTITPAGMFGFNITITNTANDDGLSPLLVVHLPNGTLFNTYKGISQDALTSCQTIAREATVECQLRNPTPGKGELQLQLYFNFNVSAIDLNTTEPLSFLFQVIDGFSRTVSANHTEVVELNTVANYTVRIDVSEDEYQATRFFTQDLSSIPLNSTGPQIPFSVIVQNDLSNTTGTPVPRTTLTIHLPTNINISGNREPLLIPTDIVFEENINCSHFEAISSGLSSIQQPTDFVLPWMGERPSPHPRCDEGGKFICGSILCTVMNLEPSDRPLQLTVFTRLFSPSLQSNLENITVYATLLHDESVEGYTELQGGAILPTPHPESVSSSEARFIVVPAVREVQRQCIAYWIVAVSVVGGIIALLIIVILLGMCGLFGTWYKAKKEEREANDSDQPDEGEFLFHTRTIPPIPGIFPEPGNPELTDFNTSAAAEKEREAAQLEEEAKLEMKAKAEVEKEPETDRYVFQEYASSAPLDRTSPLGLEDLTFDPHKGVDEDYEGPETEI